MWTCSLNVCSELRKVTKRCRQPERRNRKPFSADAPALETISVPFEPAMPQPSTRIRRRSKSFPSSLNATRPEVIALQDCRDDPIDKLHHLLTRFRYPETSSTRSKRTSATLSRSYFFFPFSRLGLKGSLMDSSTTFFGNRSLSVRFFI